MAYTLALHIKPIADTT